MANPRSKSPRRRRGRARKRRPDGGAPGSATHGAAPRAGDGEAGGSPASERTRSEERPRRRARAQRGASGKAPGAASGGFRAPQSLGPRPQAPWHPWPISELLILVGAIGVVVGMTRLGHGGIASGGPVLFAGLAAVALGTFETAWREHNAGYRSHTLLLALLPVVVLHSAIALGLAAITTVPVLVNVALLALDAGVFLVLFKVLRARFLDARARVVSRL